MPSTPSDKTPRELVEYLLESGSSPTVLARFDDWVRANPDVDGGKLYGEMAAQPPHIVNIGTLRKAGKYLWGPAFEPQEDNGESAADVEALQEENARLKQQLREANTERVHLQRQLDLSYGKAAELEKKVMTQRVRGGA